MNEKRLNYFISLTFFLSGMTGLIYQVLWSKYLSNIFGTTSIAHTTVLAVFMGGLALGNAIFGRYADKTKVSLLKVYGLLEGGIGLYVFFYPNIIKYIELFYISFARTLVLPSTHPGLISLQLILNSVAILIPATLMGGTIPVMVKYLTKNSATILKNLSKLYYINSFGAVLGSLICGFYLIRIFGLDSSITIVAIINIVIGICVYTISDRMPAASVQPAASQSENTVSAKAAILSRPQILVVLLTIFISGGISMLYELLWIRILIQFFGSSVYSFALVVSAFIFGITVGSALLNRFHLPDQMKNFKIYGLLQFGIASTMLISVYMIAALPEKIWYLHQTIQPHSYTYTFFLLCKFAMSVSLLLLPTTIIGMTLPLAGRLCSEKLELLGKNVGDVFSWNTIGALIGSIVTGFVLMPLLGVEETFLTGILINSILGCIVLLFMNRRSAYLGAFMLICVALITALVPPGLNNKHFMLSVFRVHSNQDQSFWDVFKNVYQNEKIVYFKEGINANVGVMHNPQSYNNVLFINGKPDASNSIRGDMSTQLFAGHIPLMLHPKAKDVLVIGFGSGVSAGVATLYPDVQNVTVIELIKEVLEAGKFFADVNENCLKNPLVTVVLDDAKNFMNITPNKYDIIISEPTNPWVSGSASLMTKETYSKMKSALNPDGFVVQWFHVYEMSEDIIEAIISTFADAFPYVTVWESLQSDIFLVGSLNPIEPNYTRMEELLKNTGIKRSLSQINADSVYNILSTQRLGSDQVRHLFYKGRSMNFDNFPFIEFNAPKAFFLSKHIMTFQKYDRLNNRGPKLTSKTHDKFYLEEYIKTRPMETGDYIKSFNFLLMQNELDTTYSIYKHFSVSKWEDLLKNDSAVYPYALNKIYEYEVADSQFNAEIKTLSKQYKKQPNYAAYSTILNRLLLRTNTAYSAYNPLTKQRRSLEKYINLGMEEYFEENPDLALVVMDFYKTTGQTDKAHEYINKYLEHAVKTENHLLLSKGKQFEFNLLKDTRDEKGIEKFLQGITDILPDQSLYYFSEAEKIFQK